MFVDRNPEATSLLSTVGGGKGTSAIPMVLFFEKLDYNSPSRVCGMIKLMLARALIACKKSRLPIRGGGCRYSQVSALIFCCCFTDLAPLKSHTKLSQ